MASDKTLESASFEELIAQAAKNGPLKDGDRIEFHGFSDDEPAVMAEVLNSLGCPVNCIDLTDL